MAARSDHFLDQLAIRHGPDELLSHFFLKAVHAAELRGVGLEFATFADLVAANAANSDSWFPITTTFRPEPGGASEKSGFVIFGRDAAGDVVATQAVRVFDWQTSDFKAEAESLRLFYARPERDRGPREDCLVTVAAAARLSGRVSYSGGVWYRPDYRRRQLTEIIPRIARAYAYAQWMYDVHTALITPQNIAKTFDRRTGYRNVAPASVIMRRSPPLPDGDLPMALAWMTPSELIDDVFGLIMKFDAQVDGGVGERCA